MMLKNPVSQELMTPNEAARWFRRSPSWLRQQRALLRLAEGKSQPLFHVGVCRAYVLGKLAGLDAIALRRVQLRALAAECKLDSRANTPERADIDRDGAELRDIGDLAAHPSLEAGVPGCGVPGCGAPLPCRQ